MNKKITELTDLPSPSGADVIAIVDDIVGTPTTKKVTATNLMTLAPVQSVAGRTGTVTLSNTDISGLGTAATTDSTAYATSAQGGLADTAIQPSDLGTASTQDVGTSDGNIVQLDATGLPAVNGSQLTNLPAADVEGPINDNLRGTANPHIGAFPNQAFKVIDNPFNSAFLAAREDGEISVITSTGAETLSKGFSIIEDSTEPDIEAVGTLNGATENYSVISGDSDSLGVNGLPIRQGFNNPDIGANSAPILISGGSIA